MFYSPCTNMLEYGESSSNILEY